MDKRGKRQAASHFDGMGFYIALLVCVVAVGVVGYYALLTNGAPNNEPNNTDPNQNITQEDNNIATNGTDTESDSGTQEVVSQEPVVVPQTIEKTTPTETEPDLTPNEQEVPVSGEISVPDTTPPVTETPPAPVVERIVAPLLGDTVSVFSADKLMYDATLDDWRTHDGIDISAAAGTQVVAAASGTVIAVGEDDRLGINIRIEHANGYVTTYASLHPETFVAVGDTVNAGDVIGTVGNTSLQEAALGAHLHFSVTKNGELIDPTAYLPKES